MLTLLVFAFLGLAFAENGIDGWLRYASLPRDVAAGARIPGVIIALNDSVVSPIFTAGRELQKGIAGITGVQLKVSSTTTGNTSSITVGTLDSVASAAGQVANLPELTGDGFYLDTTGSGARIIGHTERGALYGAFEYLSMLAQGNFSEVSYASNPSAPIRWANQWDNLDGSIERGYAGPSIFFKNGAVVSDLTRVSQYARLLASVGINGLVVNNVNAALAANIPLLNSANIAGLGRIADAMRPWGVRLALSLNFDAPRNNGGLATSDPFDSAVIKFWDDKTAELYRSIPDLAGFLVKANSEDQPGPLTYNRTLADGANLFAKALKPHGDGLVMFRAFVYDHHLTEDNWKNDRANAAVDFFKHLDGQFDDNVVIQIKYGPIDFQVREPPSPLFANLLQSNVAIELQVTQEYLGQQNHLVYLPPLWKTILDYDLKVEGQSSVIGRDILTGHRFNRSTNGYASVINVGTNTTWLGHHLAMSNFYAYGRLAWDPLRDETQIVEEWAHLTFGSDRKVIDTITDMSLESWPAYENYTGNLGIQTLTDITGPHYGPNPASQDGNGWGQWTRADATTIGMDRTVWNGTGFSGQYPPEIAAKYEKIETTPDDLLLWFHHVPYTQRLKSGKTVIQHFYDAHYAGAETVQSFPERWASLKGLIDDERFNEVAFRLEYQTGHAIVWRDAINEFYRNMSSIPDDQGRVGNHTWRIEAEKMTLSGYQAVSVTPFETASGRKAITTSSNQTTGTATATLDFPSGVYNIGVNYYDVMGGRAKYEILLNGQTLGKWEGNLEDKLGNTFSSQLNGHSAARVYFKGVNVEKGAVLTIRGTPDGGEPAPLDYVSILPIGRVD
ncbi:hypothetical protein JX265_001698 [Neoarthrinium moseri]|uniref:Alpha-glucuronidase n=1 Tax=Neoarthrinium moseri TaxID=1658444 RepID=A0A9P9WVH8_9PEZI|nr:hypothetical protein JX265_001698 [Neoarthrinium moseri]